MIISFSAFDCDLNNCGIENMENTSAQKKSDQSADEKKNSFDDGATRKAMIIKITVLK